MQVMRLLQAQIDRRNATARISDQRRRDETQRLIEAGNEQATKGKQEYDRKQALAQRARLAKRRGKAEAGDAEAIERERVRKKFKEKKEADQSKESTERNPLVMTDDGEGHREREEEEMSDAEEETEGRFQPH